ncbi:hypothetical protein, partial [Microcoleus sp. B4-D4]|uniref:hypothetical protein n=1 Tax=Microcoleus sp. B4-D4 TaxID=2818667 RepID=UPI002FCF6976
REFSLVAGNAMYGLITVIHVSTNRTEILRQFPHAVIERLISVAVHALHNTVLLPSSFCHKNKFAD